MTLLQPQWLWLLLFFGLYALYRRRTAGGTRTAKAVALAAALVCGILALSRPVLPQAPAEIERRGSDVVFAVDISRSMQAADTTPTRLAAAKRVLKETVLADDRQRFGVIAFTTNPIILSPMTGDDELLLHLFSGLDTSMVLTRGTDISAALELARKLSRSPHPIVVLLTDGGDDRSYAREAAWAKAQGMIVDVVLLGTAAGSTLGGEDGKLLRDEAGGIVVTARNGAVRALASATGGETIEGPDGAALLGAIARQSRAETASKSKIVLYEELFYIPLALALLFAMLGMTDLLQRWGKHRA